MPNRIQAARKKSFLGPVPENAKLQNTGSLADRRSQRVGGVRRQGESQQQFRSRMDGTTDPNSDINAIFQGIQQTRGMVRRNLDGTLQAAAKPQGLDALYAMNPHLKGAAEQQQINDAIYKANAPVRAAQAVADLKAKQEAANVNPNLATGADGYRTIFGPKGQVVGTTAPVGDGSKMVFDDASGQMVPMDQWLSERQKVQASKGMAPTPMQQAAQRSVASKPSGVDQIFGGGAKQVSPSGGASGDLVGSSSSQGAPGGELFGQVPEFRSSGMPLQPVNDTPGAWAAMARQKAFPSDKMTKPLTPPASPAQMEVLKRLFRLFGTQSPASAGLESIFTDIIPGKPDWATLQQLFPGVVQPGVGSAQNLRALQSLYLNPVHQIFF